MTEAATIRLRPVESADIPTIFGWRNDPAVRRWMFDPRPLTATEHDGFWRARLRMDDPLAFIVQADGEACGVVRLDRSGERAEVDVFIATGWQARGYGTAALEVLAAHARARGITRLIARIKQDNDRSRRAFERSGFTPDHVVYERTL